MQSLNGDIMSVGSWMKVVVIVKVPKQPRPPNHHKLAHRYYKRNNNPNWKYILSRFALSGSGHTSFSVKFKLLEGKTHIVWVNCGFGEVDISLCASGWEFLNVDDLVFSVAAAPPTTTFMPALRPSASSLTFYASLPPIKLPTSWVSRHCQVVFASTSLYLIRFL